MTSVDVRRLVKGLKATAIFGVACVICALVAMRLGLSESASSGIGLAAGLALAIGYVWIAHKQAGTGLPQRSATQGDQDGIDEHT